MTMHMEHGAQCQEAEIWKPVVGCEGQYEVSNLGRVRSLDRQTTEKYPPYRVWNLKGKILATPPDTDGYPQVWLPKPSRGMRRVCKLVLEAFVGPKPDDAEALHGDGDNKNSHLLNLSWGTHAQNMQDRLRHGRSHLAKLDDDKVAAILHSTKSPAALASEFSVDRRTIARIKAREIWRHVT